MLIQFTCPLDCTIRQVPDRRDQNEQLDSIHFLLRLVCDVMFESIITVSNPIFGRSVECRDIIETHPTPNQQEQGRDDTGDDDQSCYYTDGPHTNTEYFVSEISRLT